MGRSHIFISISGEIVVVQTYRNSKIVRRTCIKPCTKSKLDPVEQNTEFDEANAIVIAPEGVDFKNERNAELNVLIKNGIFMVTP